MQDEAASHSIEAEAHYWEDLARVINDGGYTKQYILNVDEI